MPTESSLLSREAIIDFCAKYGGHDNRHLPLPDVATNTPAFFVKFGGHDIFDEAKTQQYFFNLAKDDPSAPGIPEVYDYFSGTGGIYYMVMKFVDGLTLEQWANSVVGGDQSSLEQAAALAAPAVEWLLTRHAPPTLGTIDGGYARHRFFKDNLAPLQFTDVKALESYVNEALSRRPRPTPLPISLSSAPLVIYHSDVKMDNFIVDRSSGRVWVVDFQHVGVLPKPFASYGLYNSSNAFAATVGKQIGYPTYEHARTLLQAAALIQQSADSALGLDESGRPKTRKVSKKWATSGWTS